MSAAKGLSQRIAERQRTALIAARPELARCTCLAITTPLDSVHIHFPSCPLWRPVRLAKDMTDHS